MRTERNSSYMSTPEQREKRRIQAREYRAKMTPEQKEKERQRLRERRKRMTEEQREKERNYHRAYRAKMTPEEREERLQYHRDSTHNRYVSMSPEEKKAFKEERKKYGTKEWKEKRQAILEKKKKEF